MKSGNVEAPPEGVQTGNESTRKQRPAGLLAEGERLHCQRVTITRGEIIEFAKRFDPQPFHIDENAAKDSLFGGLIASSLHSLSACTRAVVEAQGDMAILSGVGMEEAKMFNPVRPGDVLSIEAWWADLKRSRTKPGLGFAAIRCKVANQNEEPIIEYGYRYMLACRESFQPQRI
jgi:acyl dehydratase